MIGIRADFPVRETPVINQLHNNFVGELAGYIAHKPKNALKLMASWHLP